jgi:parallel beta-helix repeat protein
VDVSPKNGQSFVGERGANCERLATLSGARSVTDWTFSGGLWKSTGHARSVDGRAVPCETGYERCDEPQDLFVNNVPMRHVGTKAAVTAGTWYFDYAAATLWLGADPTGKNVELSVTEAAFRPTGSTVKVAGLRISKYANKPQFGVVGRQGTAPGWTIQDNEITLSHSVAAVLGTNARLIDNVISQHGGLGVKVLGDGVVATGNRISDSGWAGQMATWEGGGIKVSATNTTIARNCVKGNRGPGLWGDKGARGVVFDSNTVFDNFTQGIFYEISENATIKNNRVGNNGKRFPWLYGGQIMISTSSDVHVFRNEVEVNSAYGNGITLIWQNRNAGTTATGNLVYDNDVTFLSSSGVTGLRTDFDGGSSIYSSNTFKDNRYHAADVGVQRFMGESGKTTLQVAKTFGQEIGSSIDTGVTRASWSCPTL